MTTPQDRARALELEEQRRREELELADRIEREWYDAPPLPDRRREH